MTELDVYSANCLDIRNTFGSMPRPTQVVLPHAYDMNNGGRCNPILASVPWKPVLEGGSKISPKHCGWLSYFVIHSGGRYSNIFLKDVR